MNQDPQRILITGYKGFVSPYLVEQCARRFPSAQRFGLAHAASQRPVADQPRLSAPVALPSVTEIEGDITDGERMRQVIQETRPDLIFHLAAASSGAASWKDPAAALMVNATGLVRLIEAIRAERLTPRILVIGSGEQYGFVSPGENPITEETPFHPANPYAVSKVAQDQLAFMFHKAYGLDIVRARPFNHFGPGQSAEFVIASFARQIALMEAGRIAPTIFVGDLSSRRDFLPVESVARAYVALAERGLAGEAYNIGSGVARSINSILQTLLEMAEITIQTQVDPERIRPVDAPELCADTRKAQRDTGWRPDEDISPALRATLDYWRASVRADASVAERQPLTPER